MKVKRKKVLTLINIIQNYIQILQINL